LALSLNGDSERLPDTATYNGVSLGAPIVNQRIDFTRTVVWIVTNPPSAADFVIGWDFGGSNGTMMAAYYTGVDPSTPYRTPTVSSGTTSPASLSVTNSEADDFIAGFFGINDTSSANGFTAARVGDGQTFRAQITNSTGESQLALSDGSGASGTVTHSWTYIDGDSWRGWVGGAIPLIPASSSDLQPLAIVSTTTTTYTDSTTARGVNYYYAVKASTASATSSYSNIRVSGSNSGRVIRLKGAVRMLGGVRLR
jgi:hypothetical protein